MFRAPTKSADARRDALQLRGRSRGEGNVSAGLGKSERDSFPDAVAATGYQGDPSIKA